jgi:hypothetical protein
MYTVCTNGLYIDFVLTHGAVVVVIIWQLDLQSSTYAISAAMTTKSCEFESGSWQMYTRDNINVC